ncbi:MAG: oxidoreductase [Candidatus Hadarchaeia archaeon]
MSEGEKLKVAIYWASSACGGCDVRFLDIDEDILDVVDIADFIFWPCAMDFKLADLSGVEEGGIDICFINGAGVRTSEDEEILEELRCKSKKVVALGSCSCLGGVPGLGNVTDREGIFKRKYEGSPYLENPEDVRPQSVTEVPEGELTLPEFRNYVRALDQLIEVDYYIPGCPPEEEFILEAVERIGGGEDLPDGYVFAEEKTLCDECSYDPPEERTVKEFKRVHEVELKDECFLKQGIICMGPATRSGCGARCIEGNFPCRGCYGPSRKVEDQGAKMVGLLGSIVDSVDEEEIERVVGGISDPLGTLYSYSLPKSFLQRGREEK